jgi:ABC-type polysaccharide/polyol phosphate transport system ATPase subunit
MSNAAVHVSGIGKRYRLVRNHAVDGGVSPSELWALRDISLDVDRGEIFGIIGRNGSGKSTLLKILTRITRPTEGTFRVEGGISALLELGIGFHPDLTGYENIFIGGALQGSSRKEIRSRLDSILELAGIGDAVHQPVRVYSSGMYIRLAFSLAVHTNPDILLLDEILAVGDESFQRRCFEIIRGFHERRATILIVSHDLRLMASLCDRVLFLDKGRMVEIGKAAPVIASYERRSGRGLSGGSLQLFHSNNLTHLYQNELKLTGKMGIYSSFRQDGLWFDSLQMDWRVESGSENAIVLHAVSPSLPVEQIWRFERITSGRIEWTIDLICRAEIQIERMQANIMLPIDFTAYAAGAIHGTFPSEFRESIGEDWDRLVVASPQSSVSARMTVSGTPIAIEFSTQSPTGALLIINSNAEMSARVLQYLKMYSPGHALAAGRHRFFEGWIELPVQE